MLQNIKECFIFWERISAKCYAGQITVVGNNIKAKPYSKNTKITEYCEMLENECEFASV